VTGEVVRLAGVGGSVSPVARPWAHEPFAKEKGGSGGMTDELELEIVLRDDQGSVHAQHRV